MPLINYLCIGVAKSGTMSIINYLNFHPEIFCHQGECHFFDSKDTDYSSYEKKFKTDKKIIGEKTPSYCYLRFSIDKIYNYNPDMKLILILREPISRAYSQYNMELNRRSGYKKKNYMHEFNKEKHICLKDIRENGDYYIVRGFYDEIIEYILQKFERKNLCILISEEIKNNQNIEYNKIYSFLGGKNIKINQNLNTHIGSYSKTIPKDLEKMLYTIYKPHNDKLYKLLGRKIEIWENYYNTLKLFYILPDQSTYLKNPRGAYKNIILPGFKNLDKNILTDNINKAHYIIYIAAGRSNINNIKHIDKNKLIIVDYSDSTQILNKKCLYYFKRSCVIKNRMKMISEDVIPISYCLKQETISWNLNDKTSDRNIDISVFLSPVKNSRDNRERVSAYIKDIFSKYNIRVGVIGENGATGRNSIQELYYQQMKKSKIVVTCNPLDWEGDYRLFESLSCKCLVFVDKMLTPTVNPFVSDKHLVYYDHQNLGQLKEKIIYYLNNKEELDKVANEGYNYVIKYHKPVDRVNQILEKL